MIANCPNCSRPLTIVRELYLNSVCVFYVCNGWDKTNQKDCGFVYPPYNWRAYFFSEESLYNDFGLTYNLNYQI